MLKFREKQKKKGKEPSLLLMASVVGNFQRRTLFYPSEPTKKDFPSEHT